MNANFVRKVLFIERVSPLFAPISTIPEEYHQELLSYRGEYFDEDAYWTMSSTHDQLGPFSLWRHYVKAHTEILLCPFTPYSLHTLHFMFANSLNVKLYDDLNFDLEEGQCNLFNLHADKHEVLMTAGQHINSFHINMRLRTLKELSVRYPVLRRLAEKKISLLSNAVNEHPLFTTATSKLLINKYNRCNYQQEDHRRYFGERCCLDLLLNFAYQEQQGDQPMLIYGVLNAATFRAIFNYIVNQPYEEHSIPELAKQFFIPEEMLRIGFRQHFAITIELFIRMQKMMMIYDLVVFNDISLPEIAGLMGFGSESRLNSAFRSYYKCDLKTLQKPR
ncbi:AraC-type DNA-binding protein [Chitinophaga sp. CF118]|uniref:hypothetical protein n=1 Tax=Chitinophaga sp. CF118 TaxID=1884367 RepID=UPI0008EACC7A|nr:hypothetical protein [Chitinophaga sp. CF118]SFD20651.1 AraC-type DNA-binding protein [Chitinophaga sp. CF118]